MAILALTRDTIHSLTNMLIWNEGPCYSIYVTFPPCSPVDALEEAEEKLNDFSMYVWITLTSFQTGKKCRIESTFKRAQILLPSFDICAVLWPFRAYLYLFLVFALPEFCALFFKAKDQFILFSSIPAFSSSLWVLKKNVQWIYEALKFRGRFPVSCPFVTFSIWFHGEAVTSPY